MNVPAADRWSAVRQWARRHPLFAAALWLVLSVVFASWHAWCLLPLGLAAGWVGLRCGGIRLAAWWLLLLAISVGMAEWRSQRDESQAEALRQSAAASFGGKVLAQARGDDGFWQAPVRLGTGPVGVGARVWWQGRGDLPVEGSRVSADGRFEAPSPPRNPGEWDRRDWMRQQGLLVSFRQSRAGAQEMHTPAHAQWMARARQVVRAAMTCGLEPEATGARVIRAVVLGDKPRDQRDLMEDFRRSGSMHVFSVSGMHVGMVAVLTWWVLGITGFSRRWLALPVIAVTMSYAWLTGAQPPAVRAAWMAAIFLGAFCFRRRPDLPNALGAVLLVLLVWDQRQLLQPGVQLSYGVVTAIAFGLPWTSRLFGRIGAPPLHVPVAELHGLRRWNWRLRQWLATTLAVSTAAAVGAAPLTAWHFGLVTPVGVVAALLLLPAVFGVMSLALLSVLLMPFGEAIQTPVNRLNSGLATFCAAYAGQVARVPGGHWKLGRERGPLLLVYDLPRGDAANCLVASRDGPCVLIDCGGRFSVRHPLSASMERLGLKPDSVVLTHPDGGHLGGGHAVWEQWPIKQALMPVLKARSPAHRTWMEQAPAAGVDLVQAAEVDGLPLAGGARLEWLHLPDAHAQDVAADQRVLVMRLHWQGWRILMMSDAGVGIEQQLLAAGADLRAEVLIAGRPRGGLSLGDEFLEAVQPRVLVLGRDDSTGSQLLDARSLTQWRATGVAVFEQARCGAVSLRPSADGDLRVRGFVSGRELRLSRD